MTRPNHPVNPVDSTTPHSRHADTRLSESRLEVVDPPAPTPLMLPSRVLAAMAVELPRDALQSLADDDDIAHAQAIDDAAVLEDTGYEDAGYAEAGYAGEDDGDDDGDDDVTLHGVQLVTSQGGSQAAPFAATRTSNGFGPELSPSQVAGRELGGLEGEISSFRLRTQTPPPPPPGTELDALFGSTHRSLAPAAIPSRTGLFGPSGKSAPPPPPSKRLSIFGSRMLFEPATGHDGAGMLPPPPALGDLATTGQHRHPFDDALRAESSYPRGGHDPIHSLPGGRGEEFEDETETKILVRSDAPESHESFSRLPSTAGYAHSIAPHTLPPHGLAQNLTQPPRKRGGWLALAGGGLVGGALLALGAYFVFAPDKGELIVDVANQQCNVLSDVHVFVDDELVCTTTPCRLEATARSHVIYAEAPGYPRTAAEAVVVEAGSVTLHKLQLGATAETGVEVRSRQAGLSLYVDGAMVGELPQKITTMSPGEHTLLITGGERYYAEERKIQVDENRLVTLDSVELKLRTGNLLIRSSEALTEAKVTLDDKPIELPFQEQLDASRRYRLTASKSGFETFDTWITFDGSTPDQQVDIRLVPKRESEARSSSRASARSANATHGTLNLNSKPVSTVVLDGMPIGQTPRVGIAVSPGTHSVVFVNPDRGRKRMSANVAAGATKSISVRF